MVLPPTSVAPPAPPRPPLVRSSTGAIVRPLANRKVVGFDFETYRIRAGLAAPRMVCLSWDDGETRGVVLRDEGIAKFRQWLNEPNTVLVAHHAVFDIGVLVAEDPDLLPDVFVALFEGRIVCTKIRGMMLANAAGELKFEWDEDLQQFKRVKFDLEMMVWKYLREEEGYSELRSRMALAKGKRKKKEKDEDDDPDKQIRLNYHQWDNVPVEKWPVDVRQYALDDSIGARGVFLKQEEVLLSDFPGGYLTLEELQNEAAFALHLMRIWGVRTDGKMVAKLREVLSTEYEKFVAYCITGDGSKLRETDPKFVDIEPGLIRDNAKRSRNMVAIRGRIVRHYTKYSLDIPFTPPSKKFPEGQVATDRETLHNGRYKEIPKDPGLVAVSEVVRLQKLLTTYVPILMKGTIVPITPEYNVMVETYRTSCAKPNLQNPPRKGGVRECFVPRDGWWFAFADYDTLEMRTLAQVCLDLFGYSALAEALKAGRDLHVMLASQILEISYDDCFARYEAGDKVVEETRQFAKIGNYGMAGGMSAQTFVDYARGQGVDITLELAMRIHAAFRKTWPEMVEYFNLCGDLIGDDGLCEQLMYVRTNMLRGDVTYTAVANGHFQHLAAIGAKQALVRALKEMYIDRTSPLFGCRAWLFAHDEIGIEIPVAKIGAIAAARAAERLQQVMIEEMKRWVVDVPIGATAVMSRRWYKGCKPIKVDGVLVPAKPEQYVDEKTGTKRTRWVADLDPVNDNAPPPTETRAAA